MFMKDSTEHVAYSQITVNATGIISSVVKRDRLHQILSDVDETTLKELFESMKMLIRSLRGAISDKPDSCRSRNVEVDEAERYKYKGQGAH